MNFKGFSFMKLLIAIVVLGILSFLAIHYGNIYSNNSKKILYIQNAKEYIRTAKSELNGHYRRFILDNQDVSYYIHINNFDMKQKLNSPWGEWKDAYVIVGVDGQNNYEYGWASKDVLGYTVMPVEEEKLSRRDVVQSGEPLKFKALGDRHYIVIIDKDGNTSDTPIPADAS